MKIAIVKTGGKQYLVKENDEIYVNRLPNAKGDKIELEALALINKDDKENIELGMPVLKEKVSAEILDQIKGEKIRVAKFKSKVRYRKVRGFRHSLSKIKIIKI